MSESNSPLVRLVRVSTAPRYPGVTKNPALGRWAGHEPLISQSRCALRPESTILLWKTFQLENPSDCSVGVQERPLTIAANVYEPPLGTKLGTASPARKLITVTRFKS